MAAWDDSSSSIETTIPGSTTRSGTNRTGRLWWDTTSSLSTNLSDADSTRARPTVFRTRPVFVQGEHGTDPGLRSLRRSLDPVVGQQPVEGGRHVEDGPDAGDPRTRLTTQAPSLVVVARGCQDDELVERPSGRQCVDLVRGAAVREQDRHPAPRSRAGELDLGGTQGCGQPGGAVAAQRQHALDGRGRADRVRQCSQGPGG